MKKGLTLIEVMIIISILAIIVAIAVPNLIQAQEQAKINKPVETELQWEKLGRIGNNSSGSWLFRTKVEGGWLYSTYDGKMVLVPSMTAEVRCHQ